MSCLSRSQQFVSPSTTRSAQVARVVVRDNSNEQAFTPTISRTLRETLFTQGNTRKLNDDDFKLYKDSSGCASLRCENDLISVHQNQIDDVVDFETFNKLKEFSSKVQNLEEEINSKLIKLKNNITTSSNSTSSTTTATTTTTTSSNSTSSTTTATTTTTTSSNSTTTTTTINNKSKKIHKDIDKLTKNIVDLVENIMPPTFLQSLLIMPKDQLQLYKLHKVVLYEYNKYIDEVYVSVNNISNRLSTSDNYSYVKNKERKSRNLFPSFKNKLNDILLKHADKFGFVGYQEQYHPEASSSSSQPSQPALSLHQEHKNKKLLKKVNKKKIRYMHNLLYKEYKEYKENNPNDINLDLKEYPPVVINQIGEKNKDLKTVDSISMHYDLSNFKTIEGNYHCIDENKATLFRLFEVPKEKEQLIVNADHAVQTYWTHIHNDFNHAPPKFKGFNYESQDSGTQPFTQHFGIFRSNNKFVYQSQDYMCKVKNDEYFNHSCCVDKMLYEINEVADYIANIMEFYYPSMYRNLSNLCFPPQVNN
ncbi:unnamed protein product [Rhizophagus irregularis]|uniref:Uncharacterized protein n=1 Tax=Rhizophagus irregularis TaxID=588596 RepID=A0A915ZR75_9GLOM|nr:unnamed protein product [Rhizophagus irregularis]CAB5383988.1 unnamed protein product [Rhizophagus irregularis]